MSLLRSALFSGQCPDGRRAGRRVGRGQGVPGKAAVRLGARRARRVGALHRSRPLVREDDARFVSAEVDRLAALMRVAVGTLQLHDQHYTPFRAPGGPPVASLRR